MRPNDRVSTSDIAKQSLCNVGEDPELDLHSDGNFEEMEVYAVDKFLRQHFAVSFPDKFSYQYFANLSPILVFLGIWCNNIYQQFANLSPILVFLGIWCNNIYRLFCQS